MDGEVAFLFIGGPHHVFHLAPVAAAFARLHPELPVVCLYSGASTRAVLDRVAAAMPSPMRIERVEPPQWGRLLARLAGRQALVKGPLLLRIARRLRAARVIVTPERTSAALRWMGHARTPLVEFNHGAGDRWLGSDRRLAAFDLLAVPGEKDVRRSIDLHGLPSERLRITGYVKLAFILQETTPPPPLFANGRPVIVYNPHFDPRFSSWRDARAVVEALLADGRYNLVLAPHIRLAEDLDPRERAGWEALADPDRLIVDFDSERLTDMSYTRAADIYVGDVSSQAYEFMAAGPRPLAFVNSHRVQWMDSLFYASWRLGEVVDDPGALIPAIERARELLPERVEAQRAAVRYAFGPWEESIARGAAIVAEALTLKPSKRPVGRPWRGSWAATPG